MLRGEAETVSLQARSNQQIWALARMLDAVRRTDPAVERAWQDRLQHRLSVCRGIVRKLERDGDLRPRLGLDSAADLLWTITSLRIWEDLVLQQGWSATRYEQHVYALLLRSVAREQAQVTEASQDAAAPQS